MQGTCINSENTVYFNTELSMVALMHTKPEVAGQLGCSSQCWKRHSVLHPGIGGGEGTGAAALGSRVKAAKKWVAKWIVPMKKIIFSTLKILYYSAKYKEIQQMLFFFKVHTFCYR